VLRAFFTFRTNRTPPIAPNCTDRTSRTIANPMHDFITVDGARLEYAWYGPSPADAPTMVFLHEGLGSVSQWRRFPAELCSRLGCGGLVYSRCGYGRSDAWTSPRTTRFMHHEALTVLPRLVDMFGIRRPIIVGHSDGASIALIYTGSGAGDPYALILEAPHVFVEDVTVKSIGELRDLYRTSDLRTRLARHHGTNVDAMLKAGGHRHSAAQNRYALQIDRSMDAGHLKRTTGQKTCRPTD